MSRTSTDGIGLIAALLLGGCGDPAPSNDNAPVKRPVARAEPTRTRPAPLTRSARILEIAGDLTLSQRERAAMAAADQREQYAKPEDAARDARELTKLLDQYDAALPVVQAELRHIIRAALHYGRAKIDDPLPMRLLDRHDPVLVEDRARKELVTMADLRALNRSNLFVAKMAGIALPQLVEEPGERAVLAARYQADASLRRALTQAGVRQAMVQAAWPKLPADRRAAVLSIVRAQVNSPETAADAARALENAVVQKEQQRVAAQRQARANSNAMAELNRMVMRQHQINLVTVRGQGVLNALTANGF